MYEGRVVCIGSVLKGILYAGNPANSFGPMANSPPPYMSAPASIPGVYWERYAGLGLPRLERLGDPCEL